MVEDRRTLVGEKVRLTNRITAALKSYFPQALEWFSDLDTNLFCDFILHWSTLVGEARKACPATLIRFYKEYRCVRQPVIDKRLPAIKTTMPLTEDEGIIIPFERLVKVFTLQLQQISPNASEPTQIAKSLILFQEPDPVFGPRLLATFGSDRSRSNSADDVCRLSGVAPVLERSGKKCWIHWRYSCPVFFTTNYCRMDQSKHPIFFLR